MQQLHLVGFTTESDHLILSAKKGAKSGSFVVPLDERLLEVIADAVRRRNASGDEALTTPPELQPPPEVPKRTSLLSPREIQARLRAGRTIGEVAREAATDEDWVAKFAPPVLAERARIVGRVRDVVFVKPRRGPSAEPLGLSVRWNLADRGIRLIDDEFERCWGAFHVGDTVWGITFEFVSRGRRQTAEWEIDLTDEVLVARNRVASDLAYVEPGRRRRLVLTPEPVEAAKSRRAAESRSEDGNGRASGARGAPRKAATRGASPPSRAAKRSTKTTGSAAKTRPTGRAASGGTAANASRATRVAKAAKVGKVANVAKAGRARAGAAKKGSKVAGKSAKAPARTAKTAKVPATRSAKKTARATKTARAPSASKRAARPRGDHAPSPPAASALQTASADRVVPRSPVSELDRRKLELVRGQGDGPRDPRARPQPVSRPPEAGRASPRTTPTRSAAPLPPAPPDASGAPSASAAPSDPPTASPRRQSAAAGEERVVHADRLDAPPSANPNGQTPDNPPSPDASPSDTEAAAMARREERRRARAERLAQNGPRNTLPSPQLPQDSAIPSDDGRVVTIRANRAGGDVIVPGGPRPLRPAQPAAQPKRKRFTRSR